MSSISSEEIISILKSEIENFDSEATDKETGTVIWVGDGIATVYGIEHAIRKPCFIGKHGGQRGLSHAGRSVKNHGKQSFFFNTAPQDHPRTDQMFLPDDVIELKRPHAIG